MAKNSPPLIEQHHAPVFTPRAVVEALMREPVRSAVDGARAFDPASGLHPSWGDVGLSAGNATNATGEQQ